MGKDGEIGMDAGRSLGDHSAAFVSVWIQYFVDRLSQWDLNDDTVDIYQSETRLNVDDLDSVGGNVERIAAMGNLRPPVVSQGEPCPGPSGPIEGDGSQCCFSQGVAAALREEIAVDDVLVGVQLVKCDPIRLDGREFAFSLTTIQSDRFDSHGDIQLFSAANRREHECSYFVQMSPLIELVQQPRNLMQ